MAAILALEGASKSYGAVRAAYGVDIALPAGEVRALAGENGAGKSTIVRLLAGVQRPDSGRLLVDGKPVEFHGPADARDAGVAVIYQEPTLFPDLSVAENVMMSRHPLGSLRRIDRGALHSHGGVRAAVTRRGCTQRGRAARPPRRQDRPRAARARALGDLPPYRRDRLGA